MKYSILLVFILFSSYSNAQLDKLKLPNGKEEIKIKYLTNIISISVTKNNKLFIENKPITINQLSNEVSTISNSIRIDFHARILIFLNIDKNTKYKIIDKIKTKLASINRYKIVYKTNSTDEKDILKGIYWRNHLSINKKDKKKTINYFKTKNGENLLHIPSPPPPGYWFDDFYYALYNNDTIKIKQIIKSKKNKLILIKNNGFLINNKRIKFNDYLKLKESISNYELINIKFSKNLKYKNYIKSIKQFNKLKSKYTNLYFFEVSLELDRLLGNYHVF